MRRAARKATGMLAAFAAHENTASSMEPGGIRGRQRLSPKRRELICRFRRWKLQSDARRRAAPRLAGLRSLAIDQVPLVHGTWIDSLRAMRAEGESPRYELATPAMRPRLRLAAGSRYPVATRDPGVAPAPIEPQNLQPSTASRSRFRERQRWRWRRPRRPPDKVFRRFSRLCPMRRAWYRWPRSSRMSPRLNLLRRRNRRTCRSRCGPSRCVRRPIWSLSTRNRSCRYSWPRAPPPPFEPANRSKDLAGKAGVIGRSHAAADR